MDIVTYALSKKYADTVVATLPSGFTYKGAVNYRKDLPTEPANGDVYTILYKGESGTEPLGTNVAWGPKSGTSQWIDLASLPGPQGEKGDKGDKGDTGATGPKGDDGLTTAIKVNDQTYTHSGGIVLLPDGIFNSIMGRDFTTNITVGHLPAGTAISSNQTIKDILYTILYGNVPPVTTFYSQYLESVNIPTTIDSTWTQNEITEAVKTTGLKFTVVGALNTGFISFAFSKSLGELQHIYQNGLPFDILANWVKSEVTYGGNQYYMYVAPSEEYRSQLIAGDYFELIW